MLGFAWLFGRRLDLDASWVAEQRFETVLDDESESLPKKQREPDAEGCVTWFAPILKKALDSNAAAIRLVRSRQEQRLRQMMCVRDLEKEHGYRWLEWVPMPWSARDSGMRAVRMLAMMFPWKKRGTIRYLHKGRQGNARCLRESVDVIAVYLTGDSHVLKAVSETTPPPE